MIPVVTTIFAFVMAMLVIAATGHNPFTAFKGIFNGTGLNWFFPWVLGDDRTNAAFNLQQTLILTASLILAGLGVSFAFKCGLFNIGANGQYIMGSLVAVWVGSSWVHMAGGLHIFLAIVLAGAVGAAWAGIAGFLKATVGAHEVITTMMLNFVASYIAQALVGRGGQLQNTSTPRIRSPATLPPRRICRSSGATRCCRDCTPGSSSHSRCRSSSG